MRVKVKHITNRSFFVKDKDGTHLIPAGYLEWLKEIYNRAVMEVTDDNANDDFSQYRVFSICGDTSTYLTKK